MNRPNLLLIFLFLLADQCFRSLALTRKREDATKRIQLPSNTYASCLDGSPYVFQLTPGNSKKWTIHFSNGGGACSDAAACEKLTKTPYGSSRMKADKQRCMCKNYIDGHADQDCTCVNLPYCDGSQFLGNTVQTTSKGTKLYSRGHTNLRASLDVLLDKYGLDKASDLMVTGESSGGLSTILNLDTVASYYRMPSGLKIHGLPVAGFTIDVGTCCHKGKCCYSPNPEQCCFRNALSEAFTFHNMSGNINPDCLRHHRDDPSACLMAVHAAPFVKTPMFIMNSKHDAWQLVNLEGLEYRGIYKKQEAIKLSWKRVRKHGQEFERQLKESLKNTNHSAYITSCVCHAACGLDNDFFSGTYFQGVWIGYKISDAFVKVSPGANREHEKLFIDDAEANYDCDKDGVVQQVGLN